MNECIRQRMHFFCNLGMTSKRTIGEVSVSQTDSNQMVCLVIPEPLPGLKELTGTLEEHWTRLIHEASWGKIGMTEVRICDHKDLKRVTIFASD